MEIRAKSKYDYESMKALAHLSLYTKANPKKRFITWSIIMGFLAVVIILEAFLFPEPIFVKVLLMLLALFLLQCFFYFILPKVQYNVLAKMKDIENEYIFCDNQLKVYSKNTEYNGETQINYSLFIKVYETSKYFFLYQTNNQVFIIDKSTIEGGTANDIKNKLMVFVKDKYIICKY